MSVANLYHKQLLRQKHCYTVGDQIRLYLDECDGIELHAYIVSFRPPAPSGGYSHETQFRKDQTMTVCFTPTRAQIDTKQLTLASDDDDAATELPITLHTSSSSASFSVCSRLVGPTTATPPIATATFPLHLVGDNVWVTRRPSFDSLVDVYQMKQCDPRNGIWFERPLSHDSLRNRLLTTVRTYVHRNRTRLTYHPGSDDRVLDIVHPSICPYVDGISRIQNPEKGVGPAAQIPIPSEKGETENETTPSPPTDMWNRPYEISDYQMLPTEMNKVNGRVIY